jgi:hypothetical protein
MKTNARIDRKHAILMSFRLVAGPTLVGDGLQTIVPRQSVKTKKIGKSSTVFQLIGA